MSLGTTVRQPGPSFRITSANNGEIHEIGPATTSGVATIMVEFAPSLDFNGQFIVMGKILGQAAADKGASLLPVPYRLVNQANNAAGYEMVSNPVNDAGIIQIPANGLSIGLLVACAQGFCDVLVYRLDGSSAV
jgi:hypothetical protein